MTVARWGHTAALLSNGRVLIAGGGGTGNAVLASTELYDPGAGTFGAAGDMAAARAWHTSILLADGKVLIAGGGYSSAELYDPVAGTFTATGSMSVARTVPTATLLANGKVLVAGGYYPLDVMYSRETETLASAELFDPLAGTFTATGSMTVPRHDHTATLLLDGTVLIAGGGGVSDDPLTSAEQYQ